MNGKLVSTAAGAWLLFAILAVLNGILRETVLVPSVGDAAGQLLSTLTLVILILLVVLALLARPWASLGRKDLVGIGAAWMALTVAFEFLFGHYLMGASWASLLSAYDLLEGRVWALVPLTLLVAPVLLRHLLDHRPRAGGPAPAASGRGRPGAQEPTGNRAPPSGHGWLQPVRIGQLLHARYRIPPQEDPRGGPPVNPMSASAPQDFPKAAFALSLGVAALAILSSVVGLAVPAFYAADPAVLQPQLLGQDLVTLVVAAPLLILAAWCASKGSLVGHVAATALTFYMAYAYATYAFGTRFNALFPVYVAILGASTFALFVLVRHLPVHRVTERVWAGMPRRSLAAAALVIVTAFVLLWGADIVPALVEGRPPDSAVQFETPTSPVHVMDLAFLLPLGVIAGVMLLRRQAMGVLLAGVFLIKGVTIALAVLSMAAFSAAAGQPIDAPVAAGIAGTLVALLLVGGPYLRALSAERGPGGHRRRGGSREPREGAVR